MAVNIKFTAQENEVIASLRAMGGETAKLVDQNIKLAQGFARADAEAKFFARGIDRVKKETEALAKAQRDQAAASRLSDAAQGLLGSQLSGPLAGVGGALGGGAGLAIGASLDGLLAVGKEVVSVTEKYNRLQIALDSATGSTNMGARSMSFIVDLANKTGQRIEVLAGSYKTLAANARGTSLEGVGVEKIFTAITKAGSGMQLSNEQIKGSLKAIGDMMNKGKIQAEELTQQFSENFPGGAKLFADALGISTAKLFKLGEEGKLISSEVLPKVAEYLEKISKEEYAKNLDTITGSANRMKNEFDLFLVDIGRSSDINTFFAAINNGLADTLQGIRGLVKSDDWASFMGLFSGNPALITAGLAKGAAMTGKSEMEKFRLADRERQQELIKVQKAIVESAANQFALDMPGKFKYDPEGAKRAADDLAKQGKILADMLSAMKAPVTPKKIDTSSGKPSEKTMGRMAFSKEYNDVVNEIEKAAREAEQARDKFIRATSLELKLKTPYADPLEFGFLRQLQGFRSGAGLGQETDITKLIPSTSKNKTPGAKEWMSVFELPNMNEKGKEIQDWLNWYRGQGKSISKEISATNELIADVMSAGATAFVESFDRLIDSLTSGSGDKKKGAFKNFFNDYLSSFGDMLSQLGAQMLTQGAILAALGVPTGGATVLPAKQLLIAGAALLASGQAYKRVKFAKGGIVSGRTFAEVGEYPNARNNPEVIAPLSKLSQLFQPYFQKAINLSGGGQNYAMQPVYLNPTVYLDGKVLATQLQKVYIQKGRTN